VKNLKQTIFYYLKVYEKFVSTSISVGVSFRTSFTLLLLMDLFFYFSTLLSVNFIYDHIQMIGPWDKNHLLFFISFMLGIDHLHMTLVSESFWELSHSIRTGDLDFALIKPANSVFSVFFRYFRPSTIINIFVVWTFIIYYGIQVKLEPLSWVLLPFLMFLGFFLFVVIEFNIAASMFWLKEGLGINFLRMQLQQLARWPNFIYASIARKFLTVCLPILLVGSGPIHFLYDYGKWPLILSMVAASIVFLFILKFVWRSALRHYNSASS